ncbi:MAG TPA: DUF2585 family protein [Pirellulales bacterium]|jgi:hypothetical protein
MSEQSSAKSGENVEKQPTTQPAGLRAWLWPGLALVVILLAAGYLLHHNGRSWWCACGEPFLWSGQIQSSHNSQHLFDPYSFTHMLHGVVFYWLLAWSVPRLPTTWRFVCAMTLEAAWELLENSAMVIERYRTATISLGYQGDSIANSLGDVISCGSGFALASYLGLTGSLILFAVTELTLVFWIRDSLILSTLMLVHPIEALKSWQQGT